MCKNCKYLIHRYMNKRGHGGGRCSCEESRSYKREKTFSTRACKYFKPVAMQIDLDFFPSSKKI